MDVAKQLARKILEDVWCEVYRTPLPSEDRIEELESALRDVERLAGVDHFDYESQARCLLHAIISVVRKALKRTGGVEW